MNTLARLPVVAAFAGVSLASSLAAAHVRLTYPTPRYPTPAMMNSSTDIKTGPCGRANGTRTTDTSRITVLQPGATIMVQFNETIDHPGFYRISFDDDGEDAFVTPTMRSQIQTGPTFTLPVLADNITDKSGGSYMVSVTLPNVECERCTLQLIQFMVANGVNTWNPAPDEDLYYTCADIALRRTGGMGGAGGMGGGGGAIPPMGGSGGTTGIGGAAAGGAGGLATGGTAGTGVTAGTGTGGAATGGTSANGGVATGGTATGGTATGGTATGGSGGAPATGGTAPGGGAPATGGATATGGTSTDGSSDDSVDEGGGCRMAPGSTGGHAFLAAALAALGVALRRRRGSRSASA